MISNIINYRKISGLLNNFDLRKISYNDISSFFFIVGLSLYILSSLGVEINILGEFAPMAITSIIGISFIISELHFRESNYIQSLNLERKKLERIKNMIDEKKYISFEETQATTLFAENTKIIEKNIFDEEKNSKDNIDIYQKSEFIISLLGINILKTANFSMKKSVIFGLFFFSSMFLGSILTKLIYETTPEEYGSSRSDNFSRIRGQVEEITNSGTFPPQAKHPDQHSL